MIESDEKPPNLGATLFSVFFFVAIAAVFLIAGCSCGDFAVCGSGSVVLGPSGTPTPSPSPTVSVTPDLCRVEGLLLGFLGGGAPSAALGSVDVLDLTPVNSSGKVPDGCQLTRNPTWNAIPAENAQVFGNGFNPSVRFLKVGRVSIVAHLAIGSGEFSKIFEVDVR